MKKPLLKRLCNFKPRQIKKSKWFSFFHPSDALGQVTTIIRLSFHSLLCYMLLIKWFIQFRTYCNKYSEYYWNIGIRNCKIKYKEKYETLNKIIKTDHGWYKFSMKKANRTSGENYIGINHGRPWIDTYSDWKRRIWNSPRMWI